MVSKMTNALAADEENAKLKVQLRERHECDQCPEQGLKNVSTSREVISDFLHVQISKSDPNPVR
jgi:hypothetical protein